MSEMGDSVEAKGRVDVGWLSLTGKGAGSGGGKLGP